MADAISYDLAATLISALSSHAVQKFGEYQGVQDELKKLAKSVSAIQAVLLDAEEQSHQSGEIMNWLRELKDVFLDAEDLFDEISTASLRQELKSNQVRKIFSRLNPLAFRLQLGPRVKEIRESIDGIANDHQRFHLEVRPKVMRAEIEGRRERTHGYLVKEEVIGRDEDKKAIIEAILDSDVEEDVSIVPIVGIGGLGKTTLAKYVYNDEQVSNSKHFDLKIWVCVSDVFDVESIIRQIMACVPDCKHDNLRRLDDLQNNLPKVIGGKKYLLVLDDVWNEDREKWDNFKTLLMGGARGSKILVTTRTKLVAEMVGTVPAYMLGSLSDDMSWSLFMRMAFGQGEEVKDPEWITIGKEIMAKCKGVPLAIRSVGGLLFYKRTKNEWLHFSRQELSKISTKKTSILPILKLSYNHLPSHLKQCFAYCSIFPKDYRMDKEELINLWIAQGFIKSTCRNQQLEDIGEEYFMDLVWRNFFQDVCEQEDRVDGHFTDFTMHDLMNDLAQLVAGEECRNMSRDASDVCKRTLHVSYDSGLNLSHATPIYLIKAEKLRTFASTDDRTEHAKIKQEVVVGESVFEEIISSFKRLRVLDMYRRSIKNLPGSISKLKHLRYLNLSENMELERLPNSVVELHNLQTLKLRGCSSLKELPKDLRKLLRLRHLDIHRCHDLSYMPRGLGELTSLHVLTGFVVGKDKSSNRGRLSELSGLNHLRGQLLVKIVGFVENASSEAREASLIEKPFLQSLALKWGSSKLDLFWDPEVIFKDSRMSSNSEVLLEGLQPNPSLQRLEICFYPGTQFPLWMMNDITACLPNLVRICLSFCGNCKYLPPLRQLGRLPNLDFLELSYLPEIEFFEDKGVVSESQSNVQHTPFAKLSELLIDNCPKLTPLPPLLPNLKRLRLSDVSESFMQQSLQHPTLTYLYISSSVDTLEALSEERLQHLVSLKRLVIWSCPGMIALPRGLCQLKKLEDLDILYCERLDLSRDENVSAVDGLAQLRELAITGIPKLESLPELLLRIAATLERLSIASCYNLRALPEWMGDLGSLKFLEIEDCRNLASLPEGISRLQSLRELRIIRCPLLEEACKMETGKDWSKIAHVPMIKITSSIYD